MLPTHKNFGRVAIPDNDDKQTRQAVRPGFLLQGRVGQAAGPWPRGGGLAGSLIRKALLASCLRLSCSTRLPMCCRCRDELSDALEFIPFCPRNASSMLLHLGPGAQSSDVQGHLCIGPFTLVRFVEVIGVEAGRHHLPRQFRASPLIADLFSSLFPNIPRCLSIFKKKILTSGRNNTSTS